MNIKSKLKNEIIERINANNKNATARDILLSFTQVDKINTFYTTQQKKEYNEFLSNCIDYDFNDNGVIIKLNAKHKDILSKLLNKFIDFEKFSNKDIKQVLELTFICLFDFKYTKKDSTDILQSFEIAKKSITINQFIIKFLQAYCYYNDMQIVNIKNDIFIISKNDFIEIKKQAYQDYNNNLIKLLNA